MSLDLARRPEPTEHLPYFSRYIDLVPAGKLPGRSDDPPPRHGTAVGGHDRTDRSRPTAAQALGHHVRDGAVRHGLAGRDSLHQAQDRFDVFVVHRPIVP